MTPTNSMQPSKLTKDERRAKTKAARNAEIVRLSETMTAIELAARYNVTPSRIGAILKRAGAKTAHAQRYGKTEVMDNTSIASSVLAMFEKIRTKKGQSRSQAVEEAMELYNRKHG